MPTKYNRVHAVCGRLRGKACLGCPVWESDPKYGKVQRFCYGLAQEVINIATHGHPHRSKSRKRISEYRARAVKYQYNGI